MRSRDPEERSGFPPSFLPSLLLTHNPFFLPVLTCTHTPVTRKEHIPTTTRLSGSVPGLDIFKDPLDRLRTRVSPATCLDRRLFFPSLPFLNSDLRFKEWTQQQVAAFTIAFVRARSYGLSRGRIEREGNNFVSKISHSFVQWTKGIERCSRHSNECRRTSKQGKFFPRRARTSHHLQWFRALARINGVENHGRDSWMWISSHVPPNELSNSSFFIRRSSQTGA